MLQDTALQYTLQPTALQRKEPQRGATVTTCYVHIAHSTHTACGQGTVQELFTAWTDRQMSHI